MTDLQERSIDVESEAQSRTWLGMPVWLISLALIVIAVNAFMLFLAITDPPASVPWR